MLTGNNADPCQQLVNAANKTSASFSDLWMYVVDAGVPIRQALTRGQCLGVKVYCDFIAPIHHRVIYNDRNTRVTHDVEIHMTRQGSANYQWTSDIWVDPNRFGRI